MCRRVRLDSATRVSLPETPLDEDGARISQPSGPLRAVGGSAGGLGLDVSLLFSATAAVDGAIEVGRETAAAHAHLIQPNHQPAGRGARHGSRFVDAIHVGPPPPPPLFLSCSRVSCLIDRLRASLMRSGRRAGWSSGRRMTVTVRVGNRSNSWPIGGRFGIGSSGGGAAGGGAWGFLVLP